MRKFDGLLLCELAFAAAFFVAAAAVPTFAENDADDEPAETTEVTEADESDSSAAEDDGEDPREDPEPTGG